MKKLSQIAGLDDAPDRFEDIFEQVGSGHSILFILDNLDYLGEEHPASSKGSLDPQYDKHFIAYLNNLKNEQRKNIFLLIPSENTFKNIKLHGMFSTLELIPFLLEELKRKEIKKESQRLLPADWVQYFQDNPTHSSLLTESIHKHASPYIWMKFLYKRLIRASKEELPFDERLKALEKEFDSLYKLSLERQLLKGKKQVQRHAKAAGITVSHWNPFSFFKKLLNKGDE